MNHSITIKTEQGDLAAVLHYPAYVLEQAKTGKYPAAVICHGFVGNRIGSDRLFVDTAHYLADQGYYVLRFDYAGCGESSGDYGGQGMEEWIAQTRRAVDYMLGIDAVDPSGIALIGHSLGAAVALLSAVRDSRIKSLVLWAPVAHPLNDILGLVGRDRHRQALEHGAADYLSYSLSASFFDSLLRYQPLQELSGYNGDVFIVHGTDDEITPVDYCFLYQKMFWMRKNGTCDKAVILQADHSFSSRAARQEALTQTAKWLNHQRHREQDWSGWMI